MKLTNKQIAESFPHMAELGAMKELDLDPDRAMALGKLVRMIAQTFEDYTRARTQKLAALCETDEQGNLKFNRQNMPIPKIGKSVAEVEKAMDDLDKHATEIDVKQIPRSVVESKKPSPLFYASLEWLFETKAA